VSLALPQPQSRVCHPRKRGSPSSTIFKANPSPPRNPENPFAYPSYLVAAVCDELDQQLLVLFASALRLLGFCRHLRGVQAKPQVSGSCTDQPRRDINIV